MVLESIINPKNAINKPLHIFVITFIFSIVAIMFSNHLFMNQSSILSIALITMIFIPFFQKLFELEENKEDLAAEKKLKGNLFQRHSEVIVAFSAFFLGIIVAMSYVYIFLPDYQHVFSLQEETLHEISTSNTGAFLNVFGKGTTASATGNGKFWVFFLNNSEVMILMFILSILFGSGAIFILTWNASVIAVYLGLFIKSLIAQGLGATTAYVYGVPFGLGMIALHGIPEITAYFVAGLAGGILSVGLVREEFSSPEFKKILRDSLILIFAAEALIFIAAWIEALL